MSLTPQVLFGAEEIRARLADVGSDIARHYGSEELCVIGLMKSCLVFMADLIRAVPADVTCHMLRVQLLRDRGTDSTRHDIIYYADIPYEGRDVLLLDDVLDTGITLDFILGHIRTRRPRSLRTCVLIDKPGERKVSLNPDWAVFTLDAHEERFLVGYGLDWHEHHRGLPYIGVIPLPVQRERRGMGAVPEGSAERPDAGGL